MGEHRTLLRIHGATSAMEVLRTVLAALPETTQLGLAHGVISVDGRWFIDELRTRPDGIVELSAVDTASLGVLPDAWLVYRQSSCSRGVDYESVELTRGTEVLLSLEEGADGHLVARVGAEVIERIARRYDDDGRQLPAPGDDVTWQMFRDRHLERIAPTISCAALLESGRPPRGLTIVEGDDVPF